MFSSGLHPPDLLLKKGGLFASQKSPLDEQEIFVTLHQSRWKVTKIAEVRFLL